MKEKGILKKNFIDKIVDFLGKPKFFKPLVNFYYDYPFSKNTLRFGKEK